MKLLALSGFVPEQICDVVRFTQYTGERNIDHYCGYVSDFISQVQNDATIDGAVFPKGCDSSRIIESYLDNTRKFQFQMAIPARQDELAIEYLAEEYKRYKESIENYFKISILDIRKRIIKINERNSILKKNYDELEQYKYSDYIRQIHDNLKLPLEKQNILSSLEENEIEQKKTVYLIGSFLSNLKIVEWIEKNGMKIVGDNLPESSRMINSKEVEVDGDIYKNIAREMLGRRLSPTQNNFDKILADDLKEIKRKKVDGVIMVIQKYCEPYEYLYSVYQKKLSESGIPILKLVALNSEDDKKMELQIEAFSDMI
ncbi:2-hydroxyacyl-CoA dehydratase family protein [uncultured Clostridium sp.]|uniref:2-hydroxyacyl-CoA dehydratase family protein n=1 Tax=uncultured Clostridium sp. TaxID=59620 RepID=UPI00259A0963|nr:2-hydroxyacyl-CoA dehydratase family protein [uncultured Clostridium sp.]